MLDELPLGQGAARSHLARFLFRGDDVFKEVSALSGGERSRLELALLFLLPANLLLLDEPTNHLDIPAREALEAFMTTTDATLLIVSHDRRLLETVCDSLWVVDDGLAVPFDGGYRAWRAAVADGWTVKAAAEREAGRLHGRQARQIGERRPGGTVGKSAFGRRRRDRVGERLRLRAGPRRHGGPRPRPARPGRQAVEGRLPAPQGPDRRGAGPPRRAQAPARVGPADPASTATSWSCVA